MDTTRGEQVARAKRTDRAEARRKYRAYQAAQEEVGAPDGDEASPAETNPGRGRGFGAQPAAPRPGERVGIVRAARLAIRTPTYLADIRSVPWLVTKTRAIWPIAAVCAAATAFAYVRITPQTDIANDALLSIIFQFVLGWPTPLLAPMLAGFLAPRATWLAGAIAGFISNALLILLLAGASGKISATVETPSASPSAAPVASVSTSALPSASAGATVIASVSPQPSAQASATAAPATLNSSLSGLNLLQAALTLLPGAIAFGAVIGAGAGWYRRFLEMIGPRGAAQSRQQKKPARKR
jgi:hypothetical protein